MKQKWLPPRQGRPKCPVCKGTGKTDRLVGIGRYGYPEYAMRPCLRCGGKGFR